MEKEPNYDNDGLDQSEEYFKKKEKYNNDDDTYPSRIIRTTTLLTMDLGESTTTKLCP